MNPLKRSLIEKSRLCQWLGERARKHGGACGVVFRAPRGRSHRHAAAGPRQPVAGDVSKRSAAERTLPDTFGSAPPGSALMHLARRISENSFAVPPNWPCRYAIARLKSTRRKSPRSNRPPPKCSARQTTDRPEPIPPGADGLVARSLRRDRSRPARNTPRQPRQPWAKCHTDAERLDVFNGFLLSANLDAVFDQGFLSFGNDGLAILSGRLTDQQRILFALGGNVPVQLRWLSPPSSLTSRGIGQTCFGNDPQHRTRRPEYGKSDEHQFEAASGCRRFPFPSVSNGRKFHGWRTRRGAPVRKNGFAE